MMRIHNLTRLFSLFMAFAVVFSLAVPVCAESDALSAEVILEAEGLEISGKVALSPTEQALLAAAQLLLNGENYGSISLTASEQALTVESNFLDQVYGLSLAGLAENLEKSIFAPDSGSAFALDEETYAAVLAFATGDMSAEMADLTAVTEELSAVVEPLVAMFAQLTEEAQDYLIYQTRKTTVTVNGTAIPATQASAIADVESLTSVCNSLMDAFETDAEVRTSVATLIDLFGELDEGTSGQDYVDIILESMPEIREEVAEMLEESEFQLTVSAYVTDDEESIPVKLELEIAMAGEAVNFAVLMSPEMDYFRLEGDDGYTTYALEFTVTYTDAVVLQLDVLEDEELEIRYQLSADDSTYVFAIVENNAYYDRDREVWYTEESVSTLAGTYAISDNLLTLTLNEVDGEDLGGTVTLNLRNNDSFTVPAFTELTGLSEGEFTQVVQDLMTGVETLDQLFAG